VEAWRTTIKHIDSRDDERSGLDSDRDDVREVERGPGNDSSQADSHKPDADSSSPRRWPAREREGRDRELNLRPSHLRHLREQGLVETHRIPGSGDHAVVLTKEGRGLLESHRARDEGARQTFYEGLRRERELEHDVQVYRAYGREAEYLHELGAEVDRVILDYELRTEYQRRLHEHDLDRDDYDGHPDRTADEIRDWALEHDLPFDDEVHFPDLRIESRELDGREDHRDIEVTTEHYPGCPWRQRRPVRVLVLPLLWFAIWWWRWHRGGGGDTVDLRRNYGIDD
jgi:hypothetical protein